MPSSGGQKCARSEEHTSELQSHDNLVCRLLLEKKKLFRSDRKSTRLHSRHQIIQYAVFFVTDLICSYVLSYPLVLSSGLITFSLFFFFNDPATPEISPLSLHGALPI